LPFDKLLESCSDEKYMELLKKLADSKKRTGLGATPSYSREKI
jgi:hypothetical protein